MGGSVRTFLVERLTPEEVALAKEVSHVLAGLRLLRFGSGLCPFVGGVLGFLASLVVAIFADQLAAALAVPLPPPSPSGNIRVAVGLGVSILFVIVGGIAGRLIGVPLLVEPRRRRATEKLKGLLSDRRLAPILQKLRLIQRAHEELYKMVLEEGYALPLSADSLPKEVRGLYPRTI
ncbi:hypothetical protein HY442_01140 [Candidatus Parcubacteria bacterium]|nr:hypothetical protein [Candidatus Parcubacteria bacterium]MBI4099116.1 hypothetical protein [Candidatus Parcubacteria bacterium]MBI4385293.1 hypothetical protein [Candidatus Parcubacteria bacterium]